MFVSPLPPPSAGPMRVAESGRARAVWLHTIAGLFVGMLTSCAPQRSEPEQPVPQPEPGEISTSRCITFTGDDRDPTLHGTPRTEASRCCESGYGFDPQLAARSCEFTEYLGESEELACVHRFLDRRGFLHELRITPIIGLELEAAVALHESGEFDDTHVAGWVPGSQNAWLSQTPTRQWALLSGWSATRRLTWTPDACDTDAMVPVILAMADAEARDDVQTPLPRLAFDEHVATSSSLLDHYARVSGEPGRHPLPDRAAALIEATLHAAAHERLEDFLAHVDPHARWGLPDRRELASRGILEDGGVAAMAALRRSAARLPEGLALHCPELYRRTVPLVRRGEATMWCMWVSDDHLDMLVFALRGRIDAGEGDASIVYIGLFPDPPRAPVIVPGEPPPPPVRPRPPIICGDPHAVDYPGSCPDADTVEEDEESEAQPPELSDSASGSGGRSSSSSSR
jgi:hypothetical protein